MYVGMLSGWVFYFFVNGKLVMEDGTNPLLGDYTVFLSHLNQITASRKQALNFPRKFVPSLIYSGSPYENELKFSDEILETEREITVRMISSYKSATNLESYLHAPVFCFKFLPFKEPVILYVWYFEESRGTFCVFTKTFISKT